MAERAAICIGVNHAGSMTPLQAAVEGARQFVRWAEAQGCHTVLIDDDSNRRVSVSEIFDAVEDLVDAAIYEQLIIYFSGHGILTAPGAEFWLLSRAPQNPNEAVNVSRSVVDARNAGIPHVVFVSDACRSSVSGPPLSGITGSIIFPSRHIVPKQGEVDIYYATRPGDPAYEVPEAEATAKYRGIFTGSLLKVVESPSLAMVEQLPGYNRIVITSRKLKDYLEAAVPAEAADIDVRLRQAPQIVVESALPKYFAEAKTASIRPVLRPESYVSLSATLDQALSALDPTHTPRFAAPPSRADVAKSSSLQREVEHIIATRGRDHFETSTGFTVFGVRHVTAEARGWWPDRPFPAGNDGLSWHVRLNSGPSNDLRQPATIVLGFEEVAGAALAILPGFVGTVIFENGRVTSVNYIPSSQTWRYQEYQVRENELNAMKAYAAVASRNGRFVVENEKAEQFAGRVRQAKGIDPTMGLYAAYAYAQAGAFDDVYSVYTYMRNDDMDLPIPFDVGMLAARFRPGVHLEHTARFAPFCPMLAQGWALLAEDDPMYNSIHGELRPHLIPSLWTTFSFNGAQVARDGIRSGRVR
jgi:hypothetical protein